MKETLINKINNSLWWHVPPRDPEAYKKRGKFFASTFNQAEFYGRPNDVPEKVSISNPLYGFSEFEIVKVLFPDETVAEFETFLSAGSDYKESWYEERIRWDAKMYRKAREMGYDAIVLFGSNGRKYLEKNRKPHSIELNLLNV
ncbi:hypothetical protein HYW39_02565 [Candidatus Curtissbacteria bacterium]|nr:hypothetical protein [Candidatus Wildermuthbacteria bacterium]MBI2594557.1 hypothetical protein [Candidatus Curtissbacteria bacterium]